MQREANRSAAIDVGGWLRKLGLEQYEAAFRENDIDDTILPSLTMTPRPEELSTRIARSPFTVMGNMMPPRDPDEEGEDEEDEDEEDDSADEPPVVREPDED
jgi:hypothetical protein